MKRSSSWDQLPLVVAVSLVVSSTATMASLLLSQATGETAAPAAQQSTSTSAAAAADASSAPPASSPATASAPAANTGGVPVLSQKDMFDAVKANKDNAVCFPTGSDVWIGVIQGCTGRIVTPEEMGIPRAPVVNDKGLTVTVPPAGAPPATPQGTPATGASWSTPSHDAPCGSEGCPPPPPPGPAPAGAGAPQDDGQLAPDYIKRAIQQNGNHPVCFPGYPTWTAWNGSPEICYGRKMYIPEDYGLVGAGYYGRPAAPMPMPGSLGPGTVMPQIPAIHPNMTDGMRKRTTASRSTLQKRLDRANATLAKLETRIGKLEQDIAALEAKISTVTNDDKRETIQDKIDRKEDTLDGLLLREEYLQNQIGDLEDALELTEESQY